MEFDKILLEEPLLIPLIYKAHCFSDTSSTKRMRYWYKELKPEMVKLVGFHCNNNRLATPEIYDKVYRFFIELVVV